ncbi:lipase, partial [Streptomyces sp. NPDC059552]
GGGGGAGGAPAPGAGACRPWGVPGLALAVLGRGRAADDPNLRLLDGRALYGEQDAVELPLPDGLHPDAAAHRRMGERFAALAFAADGPFATPAAP